MTSCKRCGQCCKTVGVEIPEPETLEDFEDIKWYIFHKGMTVYIGRLGEWNLEIESHCKYLDTEKGCMIYGEKPPICNEFDPSVCSVEDNEGVIEFTTPDQVDEYVEKLKNQGKL